MEKKFQYINDKEVKQRVKKGAVLINNYFHSGIIQSTDFLSPIEENFLCVELKSAHILYHRYRMHPDAERSVLFIGTDDVTQELLMEAVAVMRIISSTTLAHSDILGALIHAGCRREEIGDILIFENEAHVGILKRRIRDVQSLTQIGRVPVEVVPSDDFYSQKGIDQQEMKSTTVTSPRLDVLIARFIPTSRSAAQRQISAKRVKLNHQVITDQDVQLKEGDLISVSGVGRFRLISFEGKSKKNKWIVQYQRTVR